MAAPLVSAFHIHRIIVIVVCLALGAQAQHGPYKYCCGIQKCQNITAACAQIPACASDCLGLGNVAIKRQNLFATECSPSASLASKDYSCFAQYLSSNTTLIDRICGQKYSSGKPAAPDALITFGQCRETCAGWDLATSSTSSGPVALLMQYIVPVVVFCWTIPRRRNWDVPDAMFDTARLRYSILKPPMLLAALILSIIVVIVDMGIWIFITFVAAGPILVGGIMELVLDYRILQHMEDVNTNLAVDNPYRRLSTNERIELMVTVLCGNLDDTIGDPRDRICEALYLDDSDDDVTLTKRLQTTQASLASILRSQGTFGAMVGAPVLFFVGSFIVALDELSGSIGDNSAAHSLAFGMWWMVILQVTIVSSCILGSNNPSTISGIVGDYRQRQASDHTRVLGLQLGEAKFLGMTPMYDSAFMPVTLWDRGRVKKRWLEQTSVWQTKSWLRRRIKIGHATSLVLLPLVAFLLVLVPTALAFLVSYTTPKICISCRSITFLIYITSQVVLVAANTWRAFADSDVSFFWTKHTHLATNIATAVAALMIAFAMTGSLFTAFVGTTLELLGVYGNCVCSIPAGKWFSPDRDAIQINLASDTLLHRQMSMYWSASGYIAIGFIMSITYLGWWYQRVLRRRFEGEISRLGEGDPVRTNSF
ncbi:cytochrome mitochondrial [Ophiostoma piceae UAMH 11346]|uniref:Cytochrome mitochondrial n=1 Tax=Ophiostoma piceae (strain UAMH 11346) TaxID=1262450 RepID=S3C6R0_OPHP1|nr:cytochrome mitochondrial [Ophiostoma piceae UAMH 11346]